MRPGRPSLLTDRQKKKQLGFREDENVNSEPAIDGRQTTRYYNLVTLDWCSLLGKVVFTECDTLKLSRGVKYSYCILKISSADIYKHTLLWRVSQSISNMRPT